MGCVDGWTSDPSLGFTCSELPGPSLKSFPAVLLYRITVRRNLLAFPSQEAHYIIENDYTRSGKISQLQDDVKNGKDAPGSHVLFVFQIFRKKHKVWLSVELSMQVWKSGGRQLHVLRPNHICCTPLPCICGDLSSPSPLRTPLFPFSLGFSVLRNSQIRVALQNFF